MPKIKVKNPEELKKSKKPIRIIGKVLSGIAIVGVASTMLGVGGKIVVAQADHYNARNEAQESGRPQEIALLKGDERIDAISEYFDEAINGNENINAEQKEVIIEGFTKDVIEKYGIFFNEETIMNMYAVASVENYRKFSEFEMKHFPRSGQYNSLFNEVNYIDYKDSAVITHEQLHGITKSILFTTGFCNGLSGSGVNEGMTAWLSTDGYFEEQEYTKKIGSIIGYDKLIRYYFNADKEGLTEELNKYLSEEESIDLLKSIDTIFSSDFDREKILKNMNLDIHNNEKDRKRHFEIVNKYKARKREAKEKIEILIQKAKLEAIKDENYMSFEKLVNDYLVLSISDDNDFKDIYR